MTYLIQELVANRVDKRAIEFRKWRQARRLSIAVTADLLTVSLSLLQRVETGKESMSRLTAFLINDLVSNWTEGMRPAKKHDRRGRPVWK